MPKTTQLFGSILVALGLAAYFTSGMGSMTALTPAFFGAALLFCAFLARNENMTKHAMHLATLVAALGFIGTYTSLPKVLNMFQGATPERPAATLVQAAMAVTCLLYVVKAVRSFLQARRDRESMASA